MIFEELADIRQKIFSILDTSKGRKLTKEEFIDFYCGIYMLHQSGIDAVNFRESNMNVDEKTIVRKYFPSRQVPYYTPLDDIFSLPNVSKIHQGITEFRREVLPEFIRTLRFTNESIGRIINTSIALEYRFLLDFLRSTHADIDGYFHKRKEMELIHPEYRLED